MVKTKVIAIAVLLALHCVSSSGYDYSWRRVLMDGSRTGDAATLTGTPAKEASILEGCKSGMAALKEVVGFCPEGMYANRPESPLSNWLADLMLVQGEKYSGVKCDVSVNNMGGIRIDMPKGDVYLDDLRSMFPFKNYLVITRVTGKWLWDLFDSMSRRQWEVVGGVRIVADRTGISSLEIGGAPVDLEKIYTVVTNSFLLDGGDGIYMGKDVVSCEVLEQDFYEAVVDYARGLKAEGKPICARQDGRVKMSYDNAPAKKKKVLENKIEVFKNRDNRTPVGRKRLTILHTNDTHSHVEPIRSGRNAGFGGIIERSAYIDSVRKADGRRNVLLLDAGDFSQGTSYFSLFGGKVEIDAMNAMKYDVATLGNHEWDNGIPQLSQRLRRAKFTPILCNYEIGDKKLASQVKPYTIVRRGGLKIGILGVLCDVSTTVDKSVQTSLRYQIPSKSINRWSTFLKKEKKCDMVIILSHCGYSINHGADEGDIQMVPELHDVDIIVGGHSHTNLKEPRYVNDADGKQVMIVTDYCWGIYVGELSIF